MKTDGLFDEAVNRRRPDDVCMCGDPMDKHDPYTDHVPVSMRDYYTDASMKHIGKEVFNNGTNGGGVLHGGEEGPS